MISRSRQRGGAAPWIFAALGCLVLLVVLLLVVGAAGFYFYAQSTPPVQVTPGGDEPAAPAASVDLRSYAGAWMDVESTENEEHVMILRVEDGKIVGEAQEEDVRFELRPSSSGGIEGTARETGETPVPIRMTLSEDGQNLVVTILPPESEPYVHTFMRMATE